MSCSLPRSDILPGVRRRPLLYDRYRDFAQDGDVLLWEPNGDMLSRLMGRVIADGTGGPFCHASCVVKAKTFLFDGSYHYQLNGYLRHLLSEVRENPGTIHVYRAIPELDAVTAHEVALNVVGSLSGTYAIGNIGLIVLSVGFGWARFIPVLRDWFRAAVRRASQKRKGAICSQDVHRAYRMKARLSLVEGKDEALISPNDLGRSPRLKYIGTLIWRIGQ